MFETLHTWELGLLEKLQQIRSQELDSFFISCNFFDSSTFYLLILIAVWGFFGRRWGARVVYLVLLSGLINIYAKALFNEPRPLALMPALGLIHTTSYGFPSGAAQTHCILAGLSLLAWPRLIPAIFFSGFFLLVSFSRIYLGAHFISDVIGGWIIGGIILYSYYRFHGTFERWLESLSAKEALVASCLIPLAILAADFTSKTSIFISLLLGVNIGLWLSAYVSQKKLQPLSSYTKKVLYTILACLMAFTILPLLLTAIKSLGTASSLSNLPWVLLGLSLTWGIERLLSLNLKNRSKVSIK